MNTLAPSRGSWLAPSPVVGSPAHWAGHTALYGTLVSLGSWTVLVGATVAESGLQSVLAPGAMLSKLPLAVAMGVSSALVGAFVGAVQSMWLDRVRGRVALPFLVPGQSLLGAATGIAASNTAFFGMVPFFGWPEHMPLETVLLGTSVAGAFVGASAALAWWLPFTFATVTGGRTGRVTVAAASVVSLWTFAVWGLLA